MERLHRAGGPADLDFVNAGGLGQAKGQDQFVLRGITGTTGHFTALPGSPRPQTNPLTLIAVIRRCFISLQLLILHPSCSRVCGGVGQLTFYLLWLKFHGPRRHGVKRALEKCSCCISFFVPTRIDRRFFMAIACCVKSPIPVQLEVLILGPDNFQSIDALAVILGS